MVQEIAYTQSPPEIHLNYFKLNSTQNSLSSIPYSISYGKAGKKEVVVFGGTHGNEPSGVEACIKYHQYLSRNMIHMNGKITFILGNPRAYRCGKRYLKEGDLNRAFNKSVDDSTHLGRRVIQIRDFFKRNSNNIAGVLDLHSVSTGNSKMVVYPLKHSENVNLAKKISSLEMHFAYHERDLSGLVIDEAANQGIDALAIECGGHYIPSTIDTAMEHITRFLINYNLAKESDLLPIRLSQKKVVQYETFAAIRSGNIFEFKSNYSSEDFLKSGEIFASDKQGNRQAPQDCYIIMPSMNSKPTDTETGFLCTRKEI